MDVTVEHLRIDDIEIAASLARGKDISLPLLVCLPGGGFNRHYFDLPGASFLTRAASAGFTVLALDRPGYGDSDPLIVESDWFPTQARLIDGAIGQAWSLLGAGRPGIVLLGHSFGATIALRVAARQPTWPLLGIAVNGTLDHTVASMEQFAAAISEVPALAPMNLDANQIREFFYGPDGTFDPRVLQAAIDVAAAPAPAIEIREWAAGWPPAAGAVTAEITQPVHIRVSEHDSVQDVSPASLERFAGRFTASAAIDFAITPGSGHNTDHHHAADSLHEEQLGFARGCR